MKKTNIIILFLMAMIALAGCHKDEGMSGKDPVITDQEITVSETQAQISWNVDNIGKFKTGVDVSTHEDMSEARRVEATKDEDKYVAIVDGLTAGAKYYFRIVVWNKFGSFEEEVKDFQTQQKTEYKVLATCQPTEGGRVTGTGTYEEGQYCTLNAIPNQGYDFLNWTENGTEVSSDENYTFKVSRDRNLEAHFSLQELTVSVLAEPDYGGNVSGGGEFTYGQSCTVTATAEEEFVFSNWTENGTVVSMNATYTFAVSTNSTLVAHFSFVGASEYNIAVRANPIEGGTVTGGGIYTNGGTCTVTATANEGYTFVNWTSYEGNMVSSEPVYSFTVVRDEDLIANFAEILTWPNGILPGRFSVSDTQQVQFSQGNLQYQASTDTWRFAINQWNYCGGTSAWDHIFHGNVNNGSNDNPSSITNTWIDVFRWGTSGYNHGAVCYQPWSTSQTESDYFAYGNAIYDLCDQTGLADWGFNAISNGGNQEGFGWRTMTHEEWDYILNVRSTSSNIRYAFAQVEGVNGLILLPDNWSINTYHLNNVNSNDEGWSFSDNTISLSQWTILEQAGAVFLPPAGENWYSGQGPVMHYGYGGHYWSASHLYSDRGAWAISFHCYPNMSYGNHSVNLCGERTDAMAVRLVHNIN